MFVNRLASHALRTHYVALNTEVDANMTHGPYIKNKVKVQSRGHSTARTYADVIGCKYIIYIIEYVRLRMYLRIERY